MVLAVTNSTGYSCQPLPLTARNGATMLRIVVKAGFEIAPDGLLLPFEEHPEAVMEDEYWGEPGASCVRYESDIILDKPLTDLVVNGSAHAPRGRSVTASEVTLSYQRSLIKRLVVTGDRFWRRGPLGWKLTDPQRYVAMPVIYDRAFGGSDEEGSEPRNRSGAGYASRHDKHFEGRACPNVEFAEHRVTSPGDRPTPAGLGVVSKNWEPRMAFAGTYDQAWMDQQFPLLPADFDSRFFQSAAPDQWIRQPHGGEQIVIGGMSPDGLLHCTLPPCDLQIGLHYRAASEIRLMNVDTVLVEPDERKLTLTWSATADIHGDPFNLLDIVIGVRKPSQLAPCGCEVI